MSHRGAAFFRAACALALAAVLVVGVPLLLVTLVGNPFPSELPSLNEIRILLTQNGQGFTDFLISTLTVLIWVIWAQLIVALVIEVVATVRHTQARRLWIAPGMQAFAARLVAAITLATALAAGPLVAPAVGALSFNDVTSIPAPSELVIDVRNARPANASSITQAPTSKTTASLDSASPQSTEVSLLVTDQTELWDLADAAYGDGVAWKLIAQANIGSIDASGLPITADTEVVAAGTKLVLPGNIDTTELSRFGWLADTRSDNAEQSSDSDSHLVRVDSGDSMWSLAESYVADQLGRPGTEAEVATYWADVVASNQDVSSGNVDMIYPGETLVMPGDANANVEQITAMASDAVRDQPSVPPEFFVADGPVDLHPTTSGHGIGASDPQTDDPEDKAIHGAPHEVHGSKGAPLPAPILADTSTNQSARAPAVGLVALGSAMLSAGVVSAIRRRRDAQRRTRPAGTMAPAPSSEAAAFEAALLHSSHELKESTQGLGWRAMPASVVGAVRTEGPVEVHATASGQLLAVAVPPISEAAADVADTGTSLMAASVIVGTEPVTGDAVLVDLVPSSGIGLCGNNDHVLRFVRSVVLDLAVSERADDIVVVAIGIGTELGDLERVHVVSSYSEALTYIMRTGHAVGDGATPVVVLAASAVPADDDSVQVLVDLGATVIAPGAATTSTITIDAEHAVISPSGTMAVLAALDDDDYRAVSELVDATSSMAIELVDPTVQIEDVLDVPAITECPIEPGPIELKILGPVEVCGAAPFSSLKAVDVIAYLAFHRHGVDADQIKTWVWPPFDPPTDKAFANVMSRARTGLGAGDDGEPYLSRAGADKTYRLSPVVTTDFDRVRALGELADTSPDDASRLDLLKQALELIRGVPFTGGAASSFAWSDNHVRAQIEYTIDEMVHRCADLAIELGDLATARWAALKGLALVPGCEQCFRRRFLIAGAGNNRSELRRAMADLEAAAMVDLGEPEAVDSISGDLLDLYNELDQALVAGTA